MVKLTKEQQKSVKRKYLDAKQWDTPINMTFLEFRRSVLPGYDCVMVKFGGIWLGIEKDGYTHS